MTDCGYIIRVIPYGYGYCFGAEAGEAINDAAGVGLSCSNTGGRVARVGGG